MIPAPTAVINQEARATGVGGDGSFEIVTEITDGNRLDRSNPVTDRSEVLMQCWLLVATKNMRVAYPPQLYASRQQADVEVQRWLWILFGLKRRGPADEVTEVVKATPSKAIHLFELPFPEWGRAGANWVCLSWEEATYPRMSASLLLCDREDADAWVQQKFRGKGAPKYSLGLPWASEVRFPVRSGVARAGAYLVQRVI